MALSADQTHVVVFPFMAHGHTLPLLDLSKALSRQHIKVSIITAPGNAKSISDYVASYSLISLIEIPFPAVDGLPISCESTCQLPSMEFHLPFVQATKQLKRPFENILQSMVDSHATPVRVISDFFLGWTLAVCQSFGVPRLVFHGMGVLSMANSKSVWLPGMNLPFTLTPSDLPETLNMQDHDNLLSQVIEVGAADANSWVVVVNSFEELERSHIPSFESYYRGGAKAWCLGPLFLYDKMEDTNKKTSFMLMQFLSEQPPNSVIYISFGTQADVPDAQLDEVAFGLEESGFPFLLVVRSKT
ncbi:UDP-glucosyltransferase, putative [Ricinus communis]|uniref:UDP-glucosyltransferase, putative n=1 Tax=Ricinus communis TaxID=3988 RepID=B9RNP3_RICCO|nr:UDP-glucosyltransferase, putative [Ricinus communis]